MAVRFLLNQEQVELSDLDPNTTLLEYLRGSGRCGTKEGCASGDCGACTVVLGELQQGLQKENQEPTDPSFANGSGLHYRAVNACITLLPALHGKQLLTVEDLADAGTLHPVQQVMVDEHAAQCGFCTPGIVMSLFALYQNGGIADPHLVEQALGGNLCRCTGYAPILKAAEQLANMPPRTFAGEAQISRNLKNLSQDGPGALASGSRKVFAPTSLLELSDLCVRYPEAQLFAGGTDLVLEITQQQRQFEKLIYLGNVVELKSVSRNLHQVRIGAGLPYSELLGVLAEMYPEVHAMVLRLGSQQIRNQGTLGGNLANASPIGDMPPVLIALRAQVVLRNGADTRTLPVEDLITGYRKTQLEPGEFIEAVLLPEVSPDQQLKVYKISKRFDDDISSVLAALNIAMNEGQIVTVSIAFGGMAEVPKRASACERVLRGAEVTEAILAKAVAALAEDFQPISDARASADYRLQVAKNLVRKCFAELLTPELETNVQLIEHIDLA